MVDIVFPTREYRIFPMGSQGGSTGGYKSAKVVPQVVLIGNAQEIPYNYSIWNMMFTEKQSVSNSNPRGSQGNPSTRRLQPQPP